MFSSQIFVLLILIILRKVLCSADNYAHNLLPSGNLGYVAAAAFLIFIFYFGYFFWLSRTFYIFCSLWVYFFSLTIMALNLPPSQQDTKKERFLGFAKNIEHWEWFDCNLMEFKTTKFLSNCYIFFFKMQFIVGIRFYDRGFGGNCKESISCNLIILC